MHEAIRQPLSHNGHGQSRDGQFLAHGIAHCPFNDLPCEEIGHGGHAEPDFFGWNITYIGKPYLIGAFSGSEAVWHFI